MVNIEKVARQIIDDPLYNTLLFEIKEKLFDQEITPQAVESLLKNVPFLVREYKEINRQSELSSIHVKELFVDKNDSEEIAGRKKEINKNVQILKNLENFESDSKNSAYPIWIGSIGVMILFMAHNVIALFSEFYSTHERAVYFFYAIIVFLTYWSYIKIKKNHDNQHKIFTAAYTRTQKLINEGIKKGIFTPHDIYM